MDSSPPLPFDRAFAEGGLALVVRFGSREGGAPRARGAMSTSRCCTPRVAA